jgi:tripartite-type tricarboxylate transporter receptor subunit TctC
MKKLLVCALLCAMAATALAEYPERTITLVVPFDAGGPTDTVARELGEALRRHLGPQGVTIENVGGAGGTLGAARVARSRPDGYTLLLHHIGMATAPALYRKLPYDPLADFEYLGLVNEVPMTLIGRPTLPASSFAELRQWIAAHKDRIQLANAGLGAASHLCGLLIQQRLAVDMTTMPFRGTAPAMHDLLGGRVDLLCDQTTHTSGPILDGKVRAYAVTSAQRLKTPALSRLPTLDEAGLKGFQITVWHGLYAPRGTPQPVLDRLNAALRAALKEPEFVRREEALGAVVVDDARLSPAGHRRFVAAEIARWAPVIQAAGQYAD